MVKLEIVDGNRGGLRGSANLSLLNRFVVEYDRGQSFILEETPHLGERFYFKQVCASLSFERSMDGTRCSFRNS